MDSTCYKCGSPVQEGTAFCPSCSAPQIRVNVPQAPHQSDSPTFAPGTPAEMQPPARPVNLDRIIAPQSGVDWHIARSGVLIAGLLMGIVSSLPFGFLLILGGGALAVSRYQRRRGIGTSTGDGAKIGALSGVIGYVIFAIIASIRYIQNTTAVRDQLVKALQEAGAKNPDPATREVIQKLSTPEGLALMLVFFMIVVFLLFLALSAFGGMLTAAISRRSQSRL